MRLSLLALVVTASALLALVAPALALAPGKLVNKDVHRSVDLTSSIVRIETEIVVENKGTTPATEYIFCSVTGLTAHAAFIEAESAGKTLTGTRVTVDGGNSECTYTSFALAKPLAAGATVVVTLRGAYTGLQRAFPEEIVQSARQQMVATLPLHLVSPYETAVAKTVVTFGSSGVVSHDVVKPTALTGQVLTYGPYKALPAHSIALVRLHYENNAPFLTITSLAKELEVSHWGANLAVEDSVALAHTGAKLKGPFSRFDYQRSSAVAGVSSVRAVAVTLPRAAADVYYRDTIGNISTSNLRYTDAAAELELRPRFPMFGGWKTEFLLGYNLPLGDSLAVLPSGKYLLSAEIASSYDEVAMARVELRVILPEGASDIEVHLPFADRPAPAVTIGNRKTYLDTTGRPVATFVLENLVPEQNVRFQVEYSLGSTSLLAEPLLLISAFALVFAAAMVYVRVDLTLAPRSPAADSLLAISALAADALGELERADAALDSFKATSNKTELARVRDALTVAGRSLSAEIATQAAAASRIDAAADGVLRELQTALTSAFDAQARVMTGVMRTELGADAQDKLVAPAEAAVRAAIASIAAIRTSVLEPGL